jgi:hypothetical protein
MRSAPKLAIRIGVAVALCAAFAYTQGGHRINQQYEHEMQDPVDDPPDAHRKGELVLGASDTAPRSTAADGATPAGASTRTKATACSSASCSALRASMSNP